MVFFFISVERNPNNFVSLITVKPLLYFILKTTVICLVLFFKAISIENIVPKEMPTLYMLIKLFIVFL